MPVLRPVPTLAAIRSSLSLALALAAAAIVPVPAAADDAGTIRFARPAQSDFDRHTGAPSASERTFMRDKFTRMRTYAPYFDSRLDWYPDAWTYKDLYAIYRDSELADVHPEWILRDREGRKLYIPFDCDGEGCTQYAGDVGNPAFRAHWIRAAVAQANGYRGLFVDDVNMEARVSYGNGHLVMPQDPRTGGTMSDTAWRRYVADFAEEIRRALPGKEIVHNALWFAGHEDPSVRRQLQASSHVELERGLNDGGLTGGEGFWSYRQVLRHVDWLHSRGKGVVLDSYAQGEKAVEYELASYFLISSGRDLVGTSWRAGPGDWWQGYDAELGDARGPRYEWNGLLRRDFERGFVLVNEPESPRRNVDLNARAFGPAGDERQTVSLGAAEGAVLIGTRAGSRASTRTVVRPIARPRVRRPIRSRASRTSRVRVLHRAVLVRGRVHRARGGRLRLAIERRTANGWMPVRRTAKRLGRHERFGHLFRGMAPGRYRVRAVYRGSGRVQGSTAVRAFRL